jgi:uncharacterized membrane protein YcfT
MKEKTTRRDAATLPAPPNFKGTPAIRFAFLDNIRSLVILLVVTIHAAVTYSGFGGWYYVEGSPGNLSAFGIAFFGLLQSFLQAWTMGILFFISAYFATRLWQNAVRTVL